MEAYNEETMNLDSTKTQKNKFWSIFWAVVWLLALSLLLLRIFVYQQVNVIGQSMQPNYSENQMLIINRIDNDLERGQVVAFYEKQEMVEDSSLFVRTFPSLFPGKNKFFLKRVIGLPGEEIEIIGSKIIIYNDKNPEGVVLWEEYIPSETKDDMESMLGSCSTTFDGKTYYYPRTEIPDEHYFLMGDNRCHSLDSRDTDHGPFPIDAFFGQEEVRYWPFGEAGVFKLPDYRYQELDNETKRLLEIAHESNVMNL